MVHSLASRPNCAADFMNSDLGFTAPYFLNNEKDTRAVPISKHRIICSATPFLSELVKLQYMNPSYRSFACQSHCQTLFQQGSLAQFVDDDESFTKAKEVAVKLEKQGVECANGNTKKKNESAPTPYF